ncbi:hypothetical protein N9I69_01435 [Planktomarina temperata]|nr:hypothetical protein [Planktomarina temperata]
MKLFLNLTIFLIFFEDAVGLLISKTVASGLTHLFVLATSLIIITSKLFPNFQANKHAILITALSGIMFVIGLNGPSAASIQHSLLAFTLFSQFLLVLTLTSNKNFQSTTVENIILIITLAFGLANALMPGLFEAISGEESGRLVGLQLNPNKFGFVCLWGLTILFLRGKYLYSFIFFGLMILSGSRSAFLILSLLIFLNNYQQYKDFLQNNSRARWTKTVRISALMIVFMIGVGFNQDRLTNTYGNFLTTLGSEDGKYVRLLMLLGGYKLAANNFPIGEGWGTFGSPLGRDIEIYDKAKISYARPIYEFTGIFDSGIGSTLGEVGVFGLAVWLLILWYSGKHLRLPAKSIIVLMLVIVIASFFRNVYSNYLYSYIILCCVAHQRR